MSWTRFMDMHSGGGCKQESYNYIYIELPYGEAIEFFRTRFGHHPEETECECCGQNYVIDERETLDHASAHERGCEWDGKAYVFRTGEPLAEHGQREDVLVLRTQDLKETP